MANERPRFPPGERGWSEKGSSPPGDERPLVDAVPAAPDQETERPESEGPESQGPGATGESLGGEEGVAPPGASPPFLSDTNESVVEEAEHGAAAEEELDAAADALRRSKAEERAQKGPQPGETRG